MVASKSGAGLAGSQSARGRSGRRTRTSTSTMLLTLACLVAVAAAAPVLYDRRQDGDLNVSADVQNVLLLFAYPQKMSVPLDILDFLKTTKGNTRDVSAGAGAGSAGLQERADQVMESFMEPNTPYHVEIGSRNAEGDGRAAEVVIAGRRRLETEAQAEEGEAEGTGVVGDSTDDELKLLGATEQCGPERERDPVTLACRLRVQPQSASENITPQQTPEVISS